MGIETNKMVKKIIMACGDGTFNLGDEAIFASFAENITELQKNESKIEIKVISNNPKKTEQLHKALTKTSNGANATITTLKVDMSITSWLWNLPKVIREFSKMDLLVWGGGNLITDGPSYLYTPYHLLKIYLAKMLGKKVIVYGIGVEPLTTKFSKYLTRTALNKVDIISVRDRWSKKLLRKYGITKPIFVTVDPAFDLRPVDDKTAEKLLDQELLNNESLNRGLLNKALVNNIAAKRDGTGPLVAICPRQVFHRTSKGLANILPVKYRLKLGLIDKKETKRFRRFEKNLAKAADYLVDKFNAKVIFIPMQMSKTQKQQDEKVCHDIIDMMKMKNKRSTIMLNSERYTPKELKGIYGQMDLVMAIRFHALVLGSGMNVPVLSIPYSAKGKRLTKMLGLEVYSMTAEEVANNTEHALIERINNIFANKTSIIKNLNAKNKDFKEMAKFNVMLVDGLLRSR